MCKVLSRKARLFLISLSCLCLLVLAAEYLHATQIEACDAECQSVSCGAGLKVKFDSSTYYGCKEKIFGTDCKGECQKCTGSTVNYHCVRKSGSECFSDTGIPSTSCGNTTYYPCEGGPYPSCTCDTSKPRTSDDACSIKQCRA